jgi:hypothetical protein
MLVIERLTPGRRLGRAAAGLGLGLAAVRLSRREIVLSAEGACPFCGTRQRLGLAGRKYRLPRRVHCSSCGQELDLDPIG